MNMNDTINFISEERQERMKQVLSQRLRALTIVLDDVFDPHNISAVLRSCDAFGIQDVHVLEISETFSVNSAISHKCEKWLSIHRWNSYETCLSELKEKGFRTCATCFSPDAIPLHDVPLDKPVALVFGNEHRGVSSDTLTHCDCNVIIPMFGFVESLNISVAAAVAMSALSQAIRARDDMSAYLTEKEQSALYAEWIEMHRKVKK